MVRGQANPIVSIIIDNNNNNNNNNDNIPLNGFQRQLLKWGRRKVITSTTLFRLQDLCRKVQLFSMQTTSRPWDSVHNSESPYWWDFVLEFSCYPYYRVFHKSKVSLTVLAKYFESFTISTGNEEIRFCCCCFMVLVGVINGKYPLLSGATSVGGYIPDIPGNSL